MDVAPGRVLAVVAERADVRTAITAVLSGSIDDYVINGDLTMDGRELVARVASQSASPAELFVGRITGVADNRRRVRDLASAEVLDVLGIGTPDVMEQRVHSLPLELQIRATFAIALARAPRLLVLDLPYSADAGSTYSEYSRLIQRLGRDGTLAIVVCTDSLAVAADVADDVLVTLDGCPVEYGSVYDICLRPAMPYTRELLRVTPSPHRALPDFSAFVELSRRDGCPWVFNCRSEVIRDCSQIAPALTTLSLGHSAACHLLRNANVA